MSAFSAPEHREQKGHKRDANTTIQPKLKIGAPNDKYEQEADAMANKVVGRIDGQSQGSGPVRTGAAPGIQRMEEEPKIQRMDEMDGMPKLQRMHEGEEEHIQRRIESEEDEAEGLVQTKADGGGTKPNAGGGMHASAETTGKINAKKGGGRALDDSTRSKMEQGFGRDFSDVRIHTDASASDLNSEVGAKAFTTGRDIFFKQGEYNPNSKEGQTLLAHELTHTIQQGKSGQAIQRAGRYTGEEEQQKINWNNGRGYPSNIISVIQETVGAEATGSFDGLTIEKIASWQEKNGLSVDGLVGDKTLWEMIIKLRAENRDIVASQLGQFIDTNQFDFETSFDTEISTSGEGNRSPGARDDMLENLDPHLLEMLAKGTIREIDPITNDSENTYNCHGYTFLGGATIIGLMPSVERILADNYRRLDADEAPQVGDIVIYGSRAGAEHSGVVAAVSGNDVTLVHSKWGDWSLFCHAPGDVPKTYLDNSTDKGWDVYRVQDGKQAILDIKNAD